MKVFQQIQENGHVFSSFFRNVHRPAVIDDFLDVETPGCLHRLFAGLKPENSPRVACVPSIQMKARLPGCQEEIEELPGW